MAASRCRRTGVHHLNRHRFRRPDRSGMVFGPIDPVFGPIDPVFGPVDDVFGPVDNVFRSIDSDGFGGDRPGIDTHVFEQQDHPTADAPLDPGPPSAAAQSELFASNPATRLNRHAVVIELPPASASVATLRTVLTCLAADVGLDIDSIDDLRLALDEVTSAVFEQTNADVRVFFTRLDDGLQVALATTGTDEVIFPSASQVIVDALVDDVSFADDMAIVTKRQRTH